VVKADAVDPGLRVGRQQRWLELARRQHHCDSAVQPIAVDSCREFVIGADLLTGRRCHQRLPVPQPDVVDGRRWPRARRSSAVLGRERLHAICCRCRPARQASCSYRRSSCSSLGFTRTVTARETSRRPRSSWRTAAPAAGRRQVATARPPRAMRSGGQSAIPQDRQPDRRSVSPRRRRRVVAVDSRSDRALGPGLDREVQPSSTEPWTRRRRRPRGGLSARCRPAPNRPRGQAALRTGAAAASS